MGYQNEFTAGGGKLHDAVKGCKVIHSPLIFSHDYKELQKEPYGILAAVKDGKCFQEESWGSQFCNEIKPKGDDIVVEGKKGLCAFATTNLDFLLRQNKIENIVIGGFLTNCCIESTMRTAYELGYNVITATDCTAATSLEEHSASVQKTFPMFSKPMTTEDILSN